MSMSDAESIDLNLGDLHDIDLEGGIRNSTGSSSSSSSRSSRSYCFSSSTSSSRALDSAGVTVSTRPASNPLLDTERLHFFHTVLKISKTAAAHDDEDSGRSQEAKTAVCSAVDDNSNLQQDSLKCEGASRTYDLATKSLTYKVNIRGRGQTVAQKVLLHNITTEARHGEVLAIMGPSGASKTTFLDALAGRICRKSMSGSVLVNGQPMTDKFKRISGYVMQDDAHFPMLTPRETLLYSARLRLPSTMDIDEKKRRVEVILELLGLRPCADTRIGNEEIGGVSGGERRRISIALDLIHEPMVLFLDEPTSGLDSTSALQVMQSLQKLAKERSRTIILTIHQPSYRILDTIDSSLVLAKGKAVYQGHHNDMIQFFSTLGFVKPEHVTVVEYVMDKIDECNGDLEILRPNAQRSNNMTSRTQRWRQRPKTLSSYDYKVDRDETLPTESEVMSMTKHRSGDLGPSVTDVKFSNSGWKETWVLSQRNFKNCIRTRTLFLSRIVIVLITSLVMATLFFNSNRDRDGVRERQVFFAFTIAILVFTSGEAMPIFLTERQIYIRETSRGAYRASSYVISYSIIILPFMLILAILCTLTSYFAVGLVSDVHAIFYFTLVLFLVLSISNAFVAFISGFAPSFIAGLITFGAASAYQFLFSGFFIPRHSIPKYWLWLHYGSFFKFSYEALLVNEFKHIPGHLWGRGMTSERILTRSDCKNDTLHQYLNILYLVCFFVGYRFLFYLTLRFKTSNIRT